MKVQLDENLPPALARALNALAGPDHEVIHVHDLVSKGTSDVELFQATVDAGIQVHITQDHHNRKQIERDAIAASGLVVFVLASGWSSLKFFDKASKLVAWWPRLMEQADMISPPAVLRVPVRQQGKGKLEIVKIKK